MTEWMDVGSAPKNRTIDFYCRHVHGEYYRRVTDVRWYKGEWRLFNGNVAGPRLSDALVPLMWSEVSLPDPATGDEVVPVSQLRWWSKGVVEARSGDHLWIKTEPSGTLITEKKSVVVATRPQKSGTSTTSTWPPL